jgi:hypothetical protein
MAVSFARDILPLFRPIDIAHMKTPGVLLDSYAYMSDAANNHANAQRVHDSLTGAITPRMPPGGPYWPQPQLDLFAKWMSDGYQP